MTDTITYRGVDRNGVAHIGQASAGETPAFIAQQLYDKRWRSATILRNGEEAGGVGPDPDGRRNWWGEAWA
jgi:hypothetical protein